MIAPMPCGFVREGVKLIVRLKHYRSCKHPACIARAQAADEMKRMIAKDLKRQREECEAAGKNGRNYR